MNLRLIVDSQRLLSARLAPFAARMDTDLAELWEARAATYAVVQRQLHDVGGRLGGGGPAAAEGANAVTRLAALPTDTIVEPRVLRGFQTLFNEIDARIAQIVEDGVARGTLAKPVTNAEELEVVRTVRALRPPPASSPSGPVPPGPTCTPH